MVDMYLILPPGVLAEKVPYILHSPRKLLLVAASISGEADVAVRE